ncbi:S41 family peptidase [Candidatus Symbiobacter mobilis]|uniref:Carboxyl-terminal processing protease n=1 Tax=Candidatus Symbiobacter mobilis CR TaxID=946483 RepID=U5N9H6_9BURK|nr:S41 family peptidase [Candidatus Symbiobacter mobilis]AGX86888.1 carboxyl-terminal processing protease [Candidatus Symbiobacter mobilis CR]
MTQKFHTVGWVCAGAVAGVFTGTALQSYAYSTSTLPLEELQQLAAVFSMIKSNYVDPVDDKKLISDAIAGMVSGLDPHSTYLDKKALKDFNEGTSGRFVGVGIEISMEDGLIKVISPIEGSPAFRAGIKPNDLVVKIDDTVVRGLTLSEGVKRMRGEPNTKVVLSIFRKDENRTFPVTIVREVIKTQSVKGSIVQPGLGWIRISQFQERTVADFAHKLEELYKAEPRLKGLVLDLRNDPGGFLDAAVAVSSAFLPTNAVVVSSNGQTQSLQSVYKAHPSYYHRRSGRDPLKALLPAVRNTFKTVPLVVLVNEGSASASEIVAGALQDHRRAKLLGSQTFGKGSVQTAVCLDPSYRIDNCPTAGVKLTTSRYYTPNGRSIQAKGIVPDFLVDETAEGNPLAALRMREADLDRHLSGGPEEARLDAEREKEREIARKKWEEERKQPVPERKPPEFGTPEDFQLAQALRFLKGESVVVSKTQVVRNEDRDKARVQDNE